MTKGRLEAFSDGVIAIIITITILEIGLPDGNDMRALIAILPLVACSETIDLWGGLFKTPEVD